MKKRILSVLLTVIMAMAVIAGCGNNGGAGEKNDTEKKQVTLTFMNRTGEDKTIAYENKLIEEFEEAHPNVKIEVQRMGADDYTQTIQTKIASGDAPDVFIIEKSILEKYATSDYLMDLSDTKIIDNYNDENLLKYEDKTYGVPVGVNTYVVTYNKEIFETAGVDIPTTLDELYDICDKIEAAGYVPFAAGYQDSWTIMADSQAEYTSSILAGDGEALLKLESRTQRFSDSDEWRAVFERLGKRYAYTQSDQFGTDWNSACTMLATGKAAMIVSGDWTANNVADMGESVDLGAFALPVSNEAGNNIVTYPPAGNSYAVSSTSAYQEEAVAFVNFITSKEAGEAYVSEGIGMCVIKDVTAPEGGGALADITNIISEGRGVALHIDADSNFHDEYRDAFESVVSTFLINGGTDIDKVLNDLDDEFDRIADF